MKRWKVWATDGNGFLPAMNPLSWQNPLWGRIDRVEWQHAINYVLLVLMIETSKRNLSSSTWFSILGFIPFHTTSSLKVVPFRLISLLSCISSKVLSIRSHQHSDSQLYCKAWSQFFWPEYCHMLTSHTSQLFTNPLGIHYKSVMITQLIWWIVIT